MSEINKYEKRCRGTRLSFKNVNIIKLHQYFLPTSKFYVFLWEDRRFRHIYESSVSRRVLQMVFTFYESYLNRPESTEKIFHELCN